MLFGVKSTQGILRDLILKRENLCLPHSHSAGTKQAVHSCTQTQKITHDQPVVSCMTTSAGNEAVVICGAERKLRLAVCRAVSLLCYQFTGESKVTKPQATSQSVDCGAARLLFKI